MKYVVVAVGRPSVSSEHAWLRSNPVATAEISVYQGFSVAMVASIA